MEFSKCGMKNLYAGQNAALESNVEKQTGSKLGKEYKVQRQKRVQLSLGKPGTDWALNFSPPIQRIQSRASF